MRYAAFALATFDNMLGTLDHVLDKALQAEIGDEALSARLVDDMFPLELQFRVAINQPLLALQQVGRTNVELEEHSYKTFAEIRERIAHVKNLLATSNAADWMAEDDTVDLTLPNGVQFAMTAQEDIRDWILPNFFFHVSMAYALLRREGIELGKMDFIPHMKSHVQAA
jgi:hypothetical protein